MYAVPTIPFGSVLGESVIAEQIIIVYARLPEHPLASVAVTVKVKLPPVVGVPEITPEDESVSPVGSVPVVTAKLYGAVPLLAVIVWL